MRGRVAFLIAGFLTVLLALEGVLRLFPVSTGLRYMPIDAESPVWRGTPGLQFTYSKGWNFRLANRGRLNNDGFIDDVDYRSGDGPLLLIGDSYVQAFAVPTAEKLAARLQRHTVPVPVYGLGQTGASMSDHLGIAEWAVQRYRPSGLVFLLSEGDIRQSRNQRGGGGRFRSSGDGYELVRDDRPGLGRAESLVNHSMLFRYLFDNLKVMDLLQRKQLDPNRKVMTEEKVREYRKISEFTLDRLGRTIEPRLILFVLNRGEPKGPGRDIDVFGEVARERGFRVLNLTSAFEGHEAATGARLNFLPVDGHWNAAAQIVAAKEIAAAWGGDVHLR